MQTYQNVYSWLIVSATVILPPVGVFLEVGCGTDLCINILLTILGFIPGIIVSNYNPRLVAYTDPSFSFDLQHAFYISEFLVNRHEYRTIADQPLPTSVLKY